MGGGGLPSGGGLTREGPVCVGVSTLAPPLPVSVSAGGCGVSWVIVGVERAEFGLLRFIGEACSETCGWGVLEPREK